MTQTLKLRKAMAAALAVVLLTVAARVAISHPRMVLAPSGPSASRRMILAGIAPRWATASADPWTCCRAAERRSTLPRWGRVPLALLRRGGRGRFGTGWAGRGRSGQVWTEKGRAVVRGALARSRS